jgi:hypothetical protein
MATQLSVTELFTPAPSGVGQFGNVPMVPASGTWLSIMLSIATTVQLPTTSWQSGAPERTILAIEAVCFAQSDNDISIMAQGGFLDSAASGTVTFTTIDGTSLTVPVTPDPSNAAQNPSGALGWLDLLTQNVYDVTRLSATYASGPLAIANIGVGSVGPYSAGTYHVGNAATSATYNNPSSLTIPSSIIAGSGGVVAGVAPGLSSTTITTSAPHGLTVGQVVYLVIPASSGIIGLNQVFGLVTAASSSSFSVSIGSSGTWTGSGTVYACTLATMQADVAGIASNAGPSQVTKTITQNTGVFASNVVGWSGSNFENNTSLAARARLSLAAASPDGPSGAYVYFAETAQQILSSQVPAYQLTNGPVVANEFANPQTGIVTTVVASATPASTTLGAAVTPGCAQNLVTGVTGANPCVVTCASPTGLTAGQSMTVTISGVLGVSTANGTFIGTYTGANSFSIPINTTGSTYTAGGSVEGGDLGQIDNLIQDNVVPDGIVGAVTASALAMPIAIVATVVVPQAYVATYQVAAVVALTAYIASLPIGGVFPTETVPVSYDGIIGALEEAGVLTLGSATYVRQIQSLTVNSGTVDVAFPSNVYQAILSLPTITVIGV